MQVDIQKAYDTVDWKAIECVFKEMGFPRLFVNWIMVAVTTVSYRFNINGEHSEVVKARMGLRQGDPTSPLLFVIVMEYLNRGLKKVQENPDFNYHAKCESEVNKFVF